MLLYCTIDNLGYGRLVDIIIKDDDYIIQLEFGNSIKKTFSFKRAFGKSIFSDSRKLINNGVEVRSAICDVIATGQFDESIIAGRDKKIKDNGDAVLSMLQIKYKFEGFMHETTIKNLVNILKDGLLRPRSDLRNFEDSANSGVLEHTSDEVKKHVRFYFCKSTPTNYYFDINNPNNMVYLTFNWNLIYLEGTQLVNGNAGSQYSESKKALDYLNAPDDFMDWESIFHRDYLPSYEECVTMGVFAYKNDIIRKRNAEMNIPRNISTKYIDKITFKTEEEYKRFIKILNDDRMLSKIEDKIVIDSSYFN